MNRQWIVAGIVVAVLSAAVGCGSQDGGAGSVEINNGQGDSATPTSLDRTLPMPQSQPPISDVPMPLDFRIDEQKSRNYAVAGVRFVDHVYSGSGDKFVLKRFFERYMVMNRWTLATFIFAQGQVMLDFEKDSERCRITIWETGWFGSARISVLLWPNKPPRSGQQLQS